MHWIVLMLIAINGFCAQFVEDIDYERLPASIARKEHGTTVSVQEFFNYGCPGCFALEKQLEPWVQAQGTHIQFSRVPVIFHAEWIYYAKAYYVAEKLHVEKKATPLLFNIIQVQKKDLLSDKAMAGFFQGLGISREVADSAFMHSTRMEMALHHGAETMSKYNVMTIPAFVVAKTYKTDIVHAKTPERLMEILTFLVQKAASEK
ncbi:MAG: thiol:disulfide interchange protein DsbA/DsbL [Legionellaceae bacterium]|nr:thiol:disulfide interchange protein DsbA/DsbL [Legionellaceae bacterium]